MEVGVHQKPEGPRHWERYSVPAGAALPGGASQSHNPALPSTILFKVTLSQLQWMLFFPLFTIYRAYHCSFFVGKEEKANLTPSLT